MVGTRSLPGVTVRYCPANRVWSFATKIIAERPVAGRCLRLGDCANHGTGRPAILGEAHTRATQNAGFNAIDPSIPAGRLPRPWVGASISVFTLRPLPLPYPEQ